MKNRREAYLIEKKRATAKSEFYAHLITGFAVCVVSIIINLSISPDSFWVKWPLLGWGIGTFFYYLWVFVFMGKIVALKKMLKMEIER